MTQVVAAVAITGGLSPALQAAWLLFLFGLVLCLAYFTSRFFGRRSLAVWRGRHMRVIESLPVGRDRSLLLVECAGRVFVVGAGQNLTLLFTITDPDEAAPLLAGEQQSEGLAFAALLERLKGLAPRRGE